MIIDKKSENNKSTDFSEPLTELAFAHYPVKVCIDGDTCTFDSFDGVKDFVLSNKASSDVRILDPKGIHETDK